MKFGRADSTTVDSFSQYPKGCLCFFSMYSIMNVLKRHHPIIFITHVRTTARDTHWVPEQILVSDWLNIKSKLMIDSKVGV